MKFFFIASLFAAVTMMYAQQGKVGINTVDPKASLDINIAPGNTNTAEGILIPRVSRARLLSMGSGSAIETSTMVYVNDVISGTASGTAVDVSNVGFYYYNGTKWIRVIDDSTKERFFVRRFTDNTITYDKNNETVLPFHSGIGAVTNINSMNASTNPSDNSITITESGNYKIDVSVMHKCNTLAAGTGHNVYIYRINNAGTTKINAMRVGITTSDNLTSPGFGTYFTPLTAGDRIQFRINVGVSPNSPTCQLDLPTNANYTAQIIIQKLAF